MAAYEVGRIPTLSESNVLIESIDKLLCRSARSVLEEIEFQSPDKFRLESVEKHRRNVDKLIMETILGLSDEEQSEIYRTVIDLVTTRLRKAKSPK